jgi:hypothetical protein
MRTRLRLTLIGYTPKHHPRPRSIFQSRLLRLPIHHNFSPRLLARLRVHFLPLDPTDSRRPLSSLISAVHGIE